MWVMERNVGREQVIEYVRGGEEEKLSCSFSWSQTTATPLRPMCFFSFQSQTHVQRSFSSYRMFCFFCMWTRHHLQSCEFSISSPLFPPPPAQPNPTRTGGWLAGPLSAPNHTLISTNHLLIVQHFHSWQYFALHKLQHGPTARGDMRDLVKQAQLLHRH